MRMNRRNVLAGIGALTAGGGAIFGSGAFSQVEATRTVSISVAGDSKALMALNVDPAIGSGDDDEVSIDLTDTGGNINASGLNQNATTTFEAALAITNQGAETVALTAPSAVSVSQEGFTGSNSTDNNTVSQDKIVVNFVRHDGYTLTDSKFSSPASDTSEAVSNNSIAEGDTIVYDLVIMTGSFTDTPSSVDIDVTIKADATDDS